MANCIAKILSYGDLHLSSKDYGAHVNYPKDSLLALQLVVKTAEERQVTHVIGLGDLTYGRFNKLEYRESVEKELQRLYEITDGKHYQLKGNHDSASYGMTEFEFYVSKGMLRPSANFSIANFNISMVDYGELNNTVLNIGESNCINFVFLHDFVKFKDTQMADYGKAIILDNFTKLYGADHIIAGHIHDSNLFQGLIVKEGDNGSTGHRTTVDYLGSMSRPSYREGHMDEKGHLAVIELYDNGEYLYDRIDLELPRLEDTFNLEAKALEKEKKAEKERRLDISDIVGRLDNHQRNVGNPEDIIMGLEGVAEKYKLKAIEFLKNGEG